MADAGMPTPKSPGDAVRLFQELVHDDDGHKIFLAFLKKKYTEQHLLFLKAAEDYTTFCKKNTQGEANLDRIEEKADSIFLTYIKAGSRQQINITQPVKDKIAQRIDEGLVANLDQPVECCFDEAKKKCVELLRGNFFHEFKATKPYEAWRNKKDGMVGEPEMSPRASVLRKKSMEKEKNTKSSEPKNSGSCTVL